MATKTGSQLLALTAARHCLFSPCSSLHALNIQIEHCPCQGFILIKLMTAWCRSSLLVSLLSISWYMVIFEGLCLPCAGKLWFSIISLHSFVLQHRDVIQQASSATWSKNLAYLSGSLQQGTSLLSRRGVWMKSVAQWLISPSTEAGYYWKEGLSPFIHSSPFPSGCTSEATESGIRDFTQLKINTVKGKKISIWISSLLCFTISLYEQNVPRTGTCCFWWQWPLTRCD